MGLEDGEEALHPCERPFRLVRVDDLKAGKSCLFATNMACSPKTVLKRYKRRWGMETSYREHNEFLAKTTSKDYTVRLLYYALAGASTTPGASSTPTRTGTQSYSR